MPDNNALAMGERIAIATAATTNATPTATTTDADIARQLHRLAQVRNVPSDPRDKILPLPIPDCNIVLFLLEINQRMAKCFPGNVLQYGSVDTKYVTKKSSLVFFK